MIKQLDLQGRFGDAMWFLYYSRTVLFVVMKKAGISREREKAMKRMKSPGLEAASQQGPISMWGKAVSHNSINTAKDSDSISIWVGLLLTNCTFYFLF